MQRERRRRQRACRCRLAGCFRWLDGAATAAAMTSSRRWPVWALSSQEQRQLLETTEPVTVRPRSEEKTGGAIQQRAASPVEATT